MLSFIYPPFCGNSLPKICTKVGLILQYLDKTKKCLQNTALWFSNDAQF